jgi:hypothetical protein
MNIKIFGGLLVAILTITSMAQAQTRTPVVTHRQHIQDRLTMAFAVDSLPATKPVICVLMNGKLAGINGWPASTAM